MKIARISRRIILFGFLGAIIVGSLLYPIDVPAQGSYPIRPNLPTSDVPGGFSNVTWASDGSINSVSGASKSTFCHVNCTTQHVFTTTWSGFARGYNPPYTLTVRWDASAIFGIYSPSAAGRVEARVEYSTNGGGSWSDIEAPFLRTAPPNSSLNVHDAQVPLSDSQDTAQVQVRGTLTVQMTSCPMPCNSNISNVNGALRIADIRINASGCRIPTGETTSFTGWNGTLANYSQTLTPPNPEVNFYGRKIAEQDPGGGGPDTCWFVGSDIAKQEAVTNPPGLVWYVDANNVWQSDSVGWSPVAVNYYRSQGSAPCQTQFSQRMVINCGASNSTYRTNLLRMGLDSINVWSERDGVYVTRAWP